MTLCRWLGNISYPLYITHYPWVYMQMSWAHRNPGMSLGAHIIVFISSVVMSVFTAYAFMRLYDMPLRKWLMKFASVSHKNKEV